VTSRSPEALALRRVVLDSFAVIALLRDERAAPVVEDLLRQARAGRVSLYLGAYNLGEVVYRMSRVVGRPAVRRFLQELPAWPVEVVEGDLELILLAADIKADHPLSYADMIAAALALRLDAEVATGDPEFAQLEGRIRLLWLER
jgi:predicted nucleic acid-binding protein